LGRVRSPSDTAQGGQNAKVGIRGQVRLADHKNVAESHKTEEGWFF